MGRVFRTVERGLAIVGLMATTAVGVAAYTVYSYRKDVEKLLVRDALGERSRFVSKLPKEFILHLDLEQTRVTDGATSNSWESIFGRTSMSLRSVVQSIEEATEDDRVIGFVATGCDGIKGLASIQELRSAVNKFNEASKRHKSIFYSDSFGEAENKTLAYYLASAFDKIYMQPSGRMTTTGICLQTPFFKDLLSKWHLDFRVWAKEEFKTAFNMFTENSLTPPHREQLTTVLHGIYDQVTEGIAEGRGLTKPRVEALINTCPLTARDALTNGFIDREMYRDDLWGLLTENDVPLPRISIRDYHRIKEQKRRKKFRKGKPEVVVMNLIGQIHSGWGRRSGVSSGRVNQQIMNLVKNRDVKAIVIRVDSTGGSYVASDAIRRQLLRAKEAGKYVVVSMGNTAASGGYFVACAANSIVANPGSLTGSIGVIIGSPFLKSALDHHGISVATLKRGNNADLLSPFVDLTEEQRSHIEELIDAVYNEFRHEVAQHRQMEVADVEDVARGRVWLGRDAVEYRLIDELGGLSEAIEIAKRGAHLPQDANVVEYPSSPLVDFVQGLFREALGLENLQCCVEMYSFEADAIFGSIS